MVLSEMVQQMLRDAIPGHARPIIERIERGGYASSELAAAAATVLRRDDRKAGRFFRRDNHTELESTLLTAVGASELRRLAVGAAMALCAWEVARWPSKAEVYA